MAPGFQYPFLVSMERTFRISWLFKYLPAILPYLMDAPSYIVVLLPRSIRDIFDFRYQIASKLEEILEKPDILHNSKRQTVYHHLIAGNIGDRGYRELTREELLHETHTLLGAGSDTVGNACTVGFFHVLNNPEVHHRLLNELDSAWSSKETDMPTSALEKMPYLVALLLFQTNARIETD
jgi:cytochrome P450